MATTKAQQIGIWIMAAIMAIGTLGSFVVIVLANDNQQADSKRFNELSAQYQKEDEAYQQKKATQAESLSKQYFETFNAYASRPAAFNKDGVKELQKEDLVVGTGEELKSDSSFSAYYIGWNPDGKVFDSSIDGQSLKEPIAVVPGGVIKGWSEGVAGMKVGGVRELTIPANLAYGEQGSGEDIPANTPLKFVIMVIPTPEAIAEPQVPEELLKLYQNGVRG